MGKREEKNPKKSPKSHKTELKTWFREKNTNESKIQVQRIPCVQLMASPVTAAPGADPGNSHLIHKVRKEGKPLGISHFPLLGNASNSFQGAPAQREPPIIPLCLIIPPQNSHFSQPSLPHCKVTGRGRKRRQQTAHGK